MEQLRTFIAIELPESLKLALRELQDRLGRGKYPWVKSVSYTHLTLPTN